MESQDDIQPALDDGIPALEAPETVSTLVTYKDRSVKARIDVDVPYDEILKQLVHSEQLGVPDKQSKLYVLRDSNTHELVTHQSLHRKLREGTNFQLALAPVIEAAEMVERLASKDERITKLATFELKRLVSDKSFRTEFIARGGLVELVGAIESATGNALAYSLEALYLLMKQSTEGWDGLDVVFIARIVTIFVSQPLVNINRPAIQILTCLALSDPHFAPISAQKKQQNSATTWSYGLPVLWPIIQRESSFFPTLSDRLSSGDQSLIQAALQLTNALTRCAVETKQYDVLAAIEANELIKAVIHLSEGDLSDALMPLVIQYQKNMASVVSLYISTGPNFADPNHKERLNSILVIASLSSKEEPTLAEQLDLLGLPNEHPEDGFQSTGLFGLSLMQIYAKLNKGTFAKFLSDQFNRPIERRCQLAAASNSVALILAEVFGLTTPDSEMLLELQPFALSYPRLHSLAVKLFYRLWAESNATTKDFDRVASLVASQVQVSLRGGNRTWYDLEREFQSIEYREIRDRQMQEIALEDDLLNKGPVRSLRARLYKESFAFIREQRKLCMQSGAWFLASQAKDPRRPGVALPKVWRFYRLASNTRYLHYLEASEPRAVRGGLEDLPLRIDLSLVTEITPAMQATHKRTPSKVNSRRGSNAQQSQLPVSASILSFSLLGADGMIADFHTEDPNTYAEFIDGLSLLRPEGYIFTKQTGDLVQTLTDIGIKVKLLDLSGDRVEIPQEMPVIRSVPPSNFYYADVVG